ncbi:hypothetical protein HanRHA438_Chr10g0473551 [Helianthus annuus]|uniref:Uncharacterized protein n=1 Tax=Helianthus annuus TaxID=4232 RepID=A0A9K3I159_HELAN|nr:hypothetical protein HanXRQr2_Chr10g0461131 [Helianthus annuus]KAJ0515253.1 hypothetical protein HanHA300_Chr10g0378631 [Helianthus annuus]KAJ0523715.1 hypothetical protein HanIR_Chr10g0496841 [Helianthus annuus]KAJ0531445.1 hypothetical protein HanHA89_Chr10g0401181 [Helianthus annuus]KAJ0698288.1 hypothetical protein HanLR1_Chr10g0378421 [Helianthus annuus]
MIFVWPIFFTVVLLFNFIPPLFDLPHIHFSLFETDFFLIFFLFWVFVYFNLCCVLCMF